MSCQDLVLGGHWSKPEISKQEISFEISELYLIQRSIVQTRVSHMQAGKFESEFSKWRTSHGRGKSKLYLISSVLTSTAIKFLSPILNV